MAIWLCGIKGTTLHVEEHIWEKALDASKKQGYSPAWSIHSLQTSEDQLVSIAQSLGRGEDGGIFVNTVRLHHKLGIKTIDYREASKLAASLRSHEAQRAQIRSELSIPDHIVDAVLNHFNEFVDGPGPFSDEIDWSRILDELRDRILATSNPQKYTGTNDVNLFGMHSVICDYYDPETPLDDIARLAEEGGFIVSTKQIPLLHLSWTLN